MRTVACPNCGAPQADAPSDRSFHCTFCGKLVEPDPAPPAPARVAPSPEPTRPAAPAGSVAIGLGVLAAFAGVLYLVFRRSPPPPAPPVVSAPAVVATAAEPKPVEAVTATAVVEAGPAPADVETNPVTLIWHARVRAATGDRPIAPGTACTLTQVVVHTGARNDVHTQLLTFQCQGRMLYDSSQQLEGMANMDDSFEEVPIAGDMLAYQYAIKQQDIGSRSGDRNQITLSTRDHFVEAFRDIPPDFHVKATVDELTAIRRGKPLLDDDAPAFPDVVRRTATVTSRSGAVPFSGSTCDLVISPAGSAAENCRVLLTCGGRVLFGAGTTGFEKCAMAGGEPVSLVDPYPTPKDHDPELSVDLEAKTATLGDVLPSGAQYTVGFSLASK